MSSYKIFSFLTIYILKINIKFFIHIIYLLKFDKIWENMKHTFLNQSFKYLIGIKRIRMK